MDNIVKEVKFNFNSSATDYNDPIEILVLELEIKTFWFDLEHNLNKSDLE